MNHFNILYDRDEYDDFKDFSTQKEEFLKESIKYETSESKSKKIQEIKINNIIKTANNDNKGEDKQKECVKSVVKYKYDPNNPYPKYILGEDENFYLNIYNFLKNRVNLQ